MKKRPSIKDVAREAGVSTATVSHVFSGKKHVNEDSAQKVRRAAEKLGYTIDRVAAQLRTRRTKIIAVLVPNLEDLFLNRFISLIKSRAEDAGYQVIVSCSRDDLKIEQDRLRALMGWRPSGLILVPCIESIPDMLLKEYPDVPVVAVDRVNPAKSKYDTITSDDFASGWEVARHLIEMDARSLLVLATSDKIFTQKERIRGIEDCAREARAMTVNTLVAGPDAEAAADKLGCWLDDNPQTKAVIGLTNVMTLAALSTFASRGIQPPKDVMLAGFHDSLWMTARRVPITTVAQPVDAIANAAWDRMRVRIAQEDDQVVNLIYKSTLIKRTSTSAD
ncbi:LacI family DNA-binding transcriptional regulator [Phaeobacter sp. J2-8]|uniref:LacI family DNA-binding transcriptional regulator n=1 Tax=Phaeobacter sp. J2-8 TaxID=2931394 RepID=UPI001FD1074F|nr:LacI family DNA-binding transcriptional regulator [Phaeobacter sp. J2-8]MCJ7873213.1 LacI family transcriptional regulator [Phaeobacter sp. J2-8]